MLDFRQRLPFTTEVQELAHERAAFNSQARDQSLMSQVVPKSLGPIVD